MGLRLAVFEPQHDDEQKQQSNQKRKPFFHRASVPESGALARARPLVQRVPATRCGIGRVIFYLLTKGLGVPYNGSNHLPRAPGVMRALQEDHDQISHP